MTREVLGQVATPALVLDRSRLAANAGRMVTRAHGLGLGLRPHLKTLKSMEAARLVIDPQHGGIAVSTLNEAAYFAARGVADVQLAVCLPPAKLPRAQAIIQIAKRFSFFVDSVAVAREVASFAATTATRLNVWIEIDCGGHRTGVAADDPVLPEIAAALGSGVQLEGVATHAGQSYGAATVADIQVIAETERQSVVEAAARLRSAGFEVNGVSAGSTPTITHARSAAGLTEWRAGVYMAGDLFQAAVQSLSVDDIAVSVLATVISHNRARSMIVVDAGGLALSKDRSTTGRPGKDAGFGAVVDLAARPSYGDLHIDDVHQEHGEIHGVSAAVFSSLPIGARVRILPNHACMTAAMYHEYLITDGKEEIIERWPRTNGWS